jgi:tRNA 2-thiouridine synthesizing protein D
MSISILVLGAPFQSEACYSAYRYAKAALETSVKVDRVFFYQSAVHSASALSCTPRDEYNLYAAWQDLKKTYQLDLVVCIAAAARRGIIDESEAKRHDKVAHNMSSDFELSGLGQLIEAIATTDRLITFGE